MKSFPNWRDYILSCQPLQQGLESSIMELTNQILVGIFVLLGFWLLVISLLLLKAYSSYKKLTSNIDQKDFANILIDIKKQLKSIDTDLDDFRGALRETHKSLKTHIQKLGFLRYNPFGNTGGDQSYCLCLLDQQDNGILITSLHARDQTRTYTKEIRAGKPVDKSPLSKEEAQCLKNAKKWSK